ncbi:hypothetical protein BCR32DRAFT_327700 [Anaeromyces robustus]|uniref:Uncharacterized protein n=1 Tax=Anaeromyces robustus TaxID=1754192 RepID=A0A1Y1X3Q9_9FUNG|nr:hypothetical protein BCR32DRAFT_327700 [Anaeromyces robustus]|eukprot:ORX80441.1 hypothetical protein BCR32DRAFT_327700 [Anaeromyces robustus]
MSQPRIVALVNGEFNDGNLTGDMGTSGTNNNSIINTSTDPNGNNIPPSTDSDNKVDVGVIQQTYETIYSTSISPTSTTDVQPTIGQVSMTSQITKRPTNPTNTNFDKTLEPTKKSPSLSIILGIGSIAALLIIALILFMFLKKRKRNNNNVLDNKKADKSETEYQIGSEFLKTDNHLTLPFGDSIRESSLTSDVISESVFYKNNANVIGSYGEIIKVDENNKMIGDGINIKIDSNNRYNINNEINNNNILNLNIDGNNVPHASSKEFLLADQKTESNSDNNYCLDVKFETPTLDIAFPKPTHKASSSISGGWYNNENSETNEANKGRYFVNNNLMRPELALAANEILNIEGLNNDENEVTKKDGKIYLKKKDDSLPRPSFSMKQTPMSNVSTAGSNSSIASSDDVIRHSPQTNLTPKKSILKKNSTPRSYNKSNRSNSDASNNTLSRNTSIKKATIGGSSITMNKSNNNISSGNLSNMSTSSNAVLSSNNSINGEEPELSSFHSLSRGNTINSSTTSASNMTAVRLPPVLSAFHHALPTPPTPTSARLFGTDGDYLYGHPINEELMVPDILTNAIGDRDVYNQEGRNLAGPYCTIRRNKNRNPRRFGSDNDDTLASRPEPLGRKTSTHRRNRSQDFTHGNDKLEYFNTKHSYKQDDFNDKENQQINIRKDNYVKPNRTTTSNLHHSKTLPRSYGSSRKYNDDNSIVYSKKVPNIPSLDNLKSKIKHENESDNKVGKDRIKRNSMEAEILVQFSNIPLTCFEEDLLKISITDKDKSQDINSVLCILKEERKLLDQVMLKTP